MGGLLLDRINKINRIFAPAEGILRLGGERGRDRKTL
jgi:hypothetical protein